MDSVRVMMIGNPSTGSEGLRERFLESEAIEIVEERNMLDLMLTQMTCSPYFDMYNDHYVNHDASVRIPPSGGYEHKHVSWKEGSKCQQKDMRKLSQKKKKAIRNKHRKKRKK